MTQLFTAFPDAKSATKRVWKKGNVAISRDRVDRDDDRRPDGP